MRSSQWNEVAELLRESLGRNRKEGLHLNVSLVYLYYTMTAT